MKPSRRLTIFGGHLPRDMFPINNNARGPNVNHNPNSLVRRKEQFIALLNICRDRDLQAWNIFRVNDDNVEALEIPSYLSPTRDDAPKILFGMSLSGAFSVGAQALFNLILI